MWGWAGTKVRILFVCFFATEQSVQLCTDHISDYNVWRIMKYTRSFTCSSCSGIYRYCFASFLTSCICHCTYWKKSREWCVWVCFSVSVLNALFSVHFNYLGKQRLFHYAKLWLSLNQMQLNWLESVLTSVVTDNNKSDLRYSPKRAI